MSTEKIVSVKDVKCHCYDGSQCETAVLAKSNKRKGYRWYVGYGSDYRPAAKKDLENFTDYTNQAAELDEAIENMPGTVVYMHVNCN